MPGTACTIGASFSSPPMSCTLSFRRATAGTGLIRPDAASSSRSAGASTAGPVCSPAATRRTVQPCGSAANAQPAVGRRERDAAGDREGGGQPAGHVGQGGEAGLQDLRRRGSGPARHQVQAVDGELVGLAQDDAEQRDPADHRDRGCGVELGRLLGQVAGRGLAVAAQGGEDLLAGGVPVRRRDPGVHRVDVGRRAGAAAPGRGDEVGQGGVVVPAPEVHADLLRPPPVEAGRAAPGRPPPPAR